MLVVEGIYFCCDKDSLTLLRIEPTSTISFSYLITEFMPISDMQSMTSFHRTLVFFDLETMELEPSRGDIIQLAAVSGDHTFNVYMMPEVAINKRTTAVHTCAFTGFEVEDYLSTYKTTVTLHQALTSFIAFLRSLKQTVLLVVHNPKRIHRNELEKALYRCVLTNQFKQLGPRYLDTCQLSKALFRHCPQCIEEC
ncbi:unnamed protein product [Boreogadus saida]